MIRLTPSALSGLRNRLRERGARASIVLAPSAPSTRDDLLANAISEQYGPFCEAMYLVMAADRKIEGAERDVIRGALRELDDRIRSYHIEAMLLAAQQALDTHGQAHRLQAIAEAIGDDRPRAEAAFLLSAAVAYADNELAPEEHAVLSHLIHALGIDNARATDLFTGSLEHVDAVLGGNANVDAADVALHAAMRLHTPEDFERLAATTDRPDVTLMLRLFASFVRSGEEMRDRATTTPRELASARAAAVRTLAEEIPPGRSPHVDEVRAALGQLGESLLSVDAESALRPLVTEAGPQAPIVALEHAIARFSRITSHALRRCGELAPEANAISGELRTSVDAVLANQQAARSTLGATIDLALQRARRTIPGAIVEAIELVLRRLVDLPAEPAPAVPVAPAPSAPSLPDWVLAYQRKVGGFYVLDALGAGGTGSVFVVTRNDERDDPKAQRFALKVPRYDAVAARSISEAEFLKHFRQEAGALLALPEHPNLAAFINFDARAKPWPVLVMELVEGTDCAKLVDARRLTSPDVVRILEGLLAGLSVMHEAGIGHLDLKPSNVVLRPDGSPVIVDFGLAGRHLRPGCATAAYAPPEVWGYSEQGAPATPLTADVYSFGCMAYELFAGDQLFQGPHDLAMLAQHMDHDGGPEPVQRLLRDPRHAALGSLLSACLRRSAAARPKATELRAELHRIGPYLSSLSWPL